MLCMFSYKLVAKGAKKGMKFTCLLYRCVCFGLKLVFSCRALLHSQAVITLGIIRGFSGRQRLFGQTLPQLTQK